MLVTSKPKWSPVPSEQSNIMSLIGLSHVLMEYHSLVHFWCRQRKRVRRGRGSHGDESWWGGWCVAGGCAHYIPGALLLLVWFHLKLEDDSVMSGAIGQILSNKVKIQIKLFSNKFSSTVYHDCDLICWQWSETEEQENLAWKALSRLSNENMVQESPCINNLLPWMYP